jgi:hypothetical protein
VLCLIEATLSSEKHALEAQRMGYVHPVAPSGGSAQGLVHRHCCPLEALCIAGKLEPGFCQDRQEPPDLTFLHAGAVQERLKSSHGCLRLPDPQIEPGLKDLSQSDTLEIFVALGNPETVCEMPMGCVVVTLEQAKVGGTKWRPLGVPGGLGVDHACCPIDMLPCTPPFPTQQEVCGKPTQGKGNFLVILHLLCDLEVALSEHHGLAKCSSHLVCPRQFVQSKHQSIRFAGSFRQG